MARGILGASYADDRGGRGRPEVAFRYRVRARVVAAAARELLPAARPSSVLDLGAAEGRTLRELRRLLGDATMVGVEASRELIAAAGELPGAIRLVHGDVCRLPPEIEPATFDLVSALAILEHLSDPLAAVREAARVLRPGGLFVATCPHPFWDRLSVRLGLLAADQHEAELDRARLTAVVGEAGLELLSYRRFMWAPFGFLPYLRVPLSPDLALRLDRAIGALRLADGLFVNQAVIARKAAHRPSSPCRP